MITNLNPPSSPYAVVRVINSLLMMTVALCGMYASVMVLEPVTREFQVGHGAGALPYTLYMTGFGLGTIVLGRFMDRFGIPVLAVTASICLPSGLYIVSHAENFWVFTLSLSVLCGFLGGAFAFGPLTADISHWFTRRRGLAIGIVTSGSYLAGALWPPILQSWIDSSGWRQSLVWLAWCSLSMLPLSLVYLKRNRDDSAINQAADRENWSRPLDMTAGQLQVALCVAGIGCCVAMSMPQIHLIPHVIDLGFDARDGAWMLSIMLGSGIVSRVASGFISDRIGGIRTLLLGSSLQALVIFLFIFVDTLTSLYLAAIAFGLVQGGITPSYMLIVRRFFRPDQAGSRIGLLFVATVGGMALGGWMAGALYDLSGSYTLSFINVIAFNIMNLAIVFYLLRRDKRLTLLRSLRASHAG